MQFCSVIDSFLVKKMKLFHVYFKDRNLLEAVETTNCASVQEVHRKLLQQGWDGGNWYGISANSKDEAIAIARKAGFKYIPPEKMTDSQKIAEGLLTRSSEIKGRSNYSKNFSNL